MRPRIALLLAAIWLLAMVPMANAASTSSSSGSSGSVTYSVQVTGPNGTRAATVTESVTPSATQSIVSLAIEGAKSNLTYSRFVNSSSELFPYLPAISNETYTHAGKTYNVTASISQDGTSQASFQGSSYTLTDYAFTATVTSANGTRDITGTVSIFPSDLVYSVAAHGAESSLTVTLTATSLPLTDAPAAPALQATSATVGIGLAVGAVAVSLGVKFRHKPQAPGPKPDHWVD